MSKTHMYRILVGAWVLALTGPAWAQSPGSSFTSDVIPPGQEALIKKMLTIPADLAQRTGCKVQDIHIGRMNIKTLVRCKTDAGATEWSVKLTSLRDPATGDGVVRTQRFTCTAGAGRNAAVTDQLVAQIRTHEAEFRWVSASRGRSATPADAPSPGQVNKPDNDPIYRLYMVGFEMFKKRQHVQAFEYFLAMAKKHADYSGVLGMLVANLAPQQPDAARVKQFTDTADKKPDSALDNFLAGVAAHYSAHYKARTKEAKRALYETAITYLKRARPAFDFEPRIFIYLSVSHYRLGHQEKAEALIEQAVELNRQDPDAFYCRAEVYHRSRPDRALKDIDRYLELTKVEGGVSSGKYNLVQRMRAYLVRVQKGEEEMTELWDPLIGDSYQVPEEASVFTDSKRGLMSLVGLAVAILLLSLLVYLIRKKLKQDSVS